MRHKQLTLKERYNISTLLKRGWKQKDIAESIGVHPSTICRELKRNSNAVSNEYSYEFAHAVAVKRKSKHTMLTSKIKTYIKTKLTKNYLI